MGDLTLLKTQETLANLMITTELLGGAGLLLTLLGAIVSACGVIMSDKTATDLASARWDINLNLKAALLKQSHTSAAGLALIGIGTACQFVALLLSGTH